MKFHWSLVLLLLVLVFNVNSQVNITETDILKQQKIIVSNQSAYKATIFIFLSSNCSCTDSHVQHIQDLYDQYRQDFSFYAILANEEETLAGAIDFFKRKNIKFPLIRNTQLAIDLNASKTPSVFIYDNKEKLIFSGGLSDAADFKKVKKFYLKEALELLRANKEIKVKHHKVLGCSI